MYQGFLVRCSWIKRVKRRRFVKRVGKFGGRPPRHYVFLYTKQRIDVCARLRLIAARVWRPWFSIPSHNSIVNRSTLLPSLPSPLPGWMEGFPIRHHDLHDEQKSLSLSLFKAPFYAPKFYAPILRTEPASFQFSFLCDWYARNTAVTLFSRESSDMPSRFDDFYYIAVGYFARQINTNVSVNDFYRILFRHLSTTFCINNFKISHSFLRVFFKGIHGYGNLELFRISLTVEMQQMFRVNQIRGEQCFLILRRISVIGEYILTKTLGLTSQLIKRQTDRLIGEDTGRCVGRLSSQFSLFGRWTVGINWGARNKGFETARIATNNLK